VYNCINQSGNIDPFHMMSFVYIQPTLVCVWRQKIHTFKWR